VDRYRPEILKLSAANFSQLIEMDELNVKSEIDVVKLLKDWVVANSELQQSLSGILSELGSISLNFGKFPKIIKI